MYQSFSFAESSKINTYTDMNEALLRASELTVEPVELTASDIVVGSDGSINIGGDVTRITNLGFESYLKSLGIPINFARTIPEDLLLTNIKRLTSDYPGLPLCALQRPNGELASIVKSPYKEIPYADVLGEFINKNPNKIILSEELMKIMFRFDELKVPDLDDNHNTFYISEYLVTSLVKEISLQINSGLYRTQCENSFIMPILGRLKANYMKRPDTRLKVFTESFECYDREVVASMFRDFSRNLHNQLYQPQLKKIWDNYSKITSKSNADMLFDWDEDMRHAALAEASAYLSMVKKAKLLGQSITEPAITQFSGMDVANKITQIAHTTLDGIDSVKAEILGGTILQWLIFSN